MKNLDDLYQNLGDDKCEELAKRSWSYYDLSKLCKGRMNAPVGGIVRESLARDLIREFLPQGIGLKPGLILDAENRLMSPQIDAIAYKGAPLLEFSGAVIAEKRQVKAAFEIKTEIRASHIFGAELLSTYKNRKPFLPQDGKYVLLAFELHCDKQREKEMAKRLKEICDAYAIVLYVAKTGKARSENRDPNYDGSVGRLIEWLRNLA